MAVVSRGRKGDKVVISSGRKEREERVVIVLQVILFLPFR